MRAMTRGDGPKLLSLAPMRARNGAAALALLRLRPDEGNGRGSAATSGVRGGRRRMAETRVERRFLLA